MSECRNTTGGNQCRKKNRNAAQAIICHEFDFIATEIGAIKVKVIIHLARTASPADSRFDSCPQRTGCRGCSAGPGPHLPPEEFHFDSRFLFFYIAVVLSAWLGGKSSGRIAAILSVLIARLPFHSPHVLHNYSSPVFMEFAATAAIVGWFSSWRKQAEKALQHARDDLQIRVEEKTADLKQTNVQLAGRNGRAPPCGRRPCRPQAELARVAAVGENADACMMWLSLDPPNLEEARAAVDAVASCSRSS